MSLTAHFSPFYLLSNARAMLSREWSQQPNWVVASRLFAVGSTTAFKICREAGIDPQGRSVRPASLQSQGEHHE